MSPDTLIDERFDELVAALRADTPAAPADLRNRVADVTAGPPPEPRRWVRRLVVLTAPVAVGLSLAVALAVGIGSAIDSRGSSEVAGTAKPGTAGAESAPSYSTEPAQDAAQLRGAGPAPTSGRAQDVSASLTLLVDGTDDLSATTQRALRATRSLGGYVLSVSYRTPEPGDGTAAVRVRIPVSRVQAAIVQFSGLGRILAQDTQISDLQQPLDDLTRRIRRLEARLPDATPADRARLREQIAALRRQRTELNRRAAYATISLDLTTTAPPTPQATPSRFDRALDDAVGILALELLVVAYALIVASPFLLLLAAALFGRRAYRRHADERLLERA